MTTKIDGTNGIIFPDSTTQSTAAVSVGVGQTWQNLTSSRTLGSTYTNSTGKPISISVMYNLGAGNGCSLTVAGNVIQQFGNNSGVATYFTVTAIVPNGATYSSTAGSGPAYTWWELR